MRSLLLLFAIVHSLSLFVAAHPFIIISTKITELQLAPQRQAVPTAHILPRQGLLDDLNSAIDSAFGVDDDTTTTTKKAKTTASSAAITASSAAKTLVPPAVATTTDDSTSTDDGDSSTSTDESSTSTTSTESSTTSESTTTSTSASSTTAVPVSTTSISQPTNTPAASSSNSSGGVSSAGIAIAVIMVLLILGVTAWLIFKYHPRCQAWWAVRQERRFRERSYRDALDGPNAGSSSLRERALGGGSAMSKRQTLKSFFVPSTAKLGNGQEIKRKPVNWGASTPSTPRSMTVGDSGMGEEKVSMTASAAPMGQIERFSVVPKDHSSKEPAPQEFASNEGLGLAPAPLFAGRGLSPSSAASTPVSASAPVLAPIPTVASAPTTRAPSRAPTNATMRPVSPISPGPQPTVDRLPPVSPLSTHRRDEPSGMGQRIERDLPPVPAIPGLIHAKRGSDGVFRLK